MKVMALSTDGDEGETSAGKTKKKRKKKKGCKTFGETREEHFTFTHDHLI